jgi:hypothetical protein
MAFRAAPLSRRVLARASAALGWIAAFAGAASAQAERPWWLRENLRVVTYEFLERDAKRTTDLTGDEILALVRKIGACDLLLAKGFHYWKGAFDDSSWGYPRFKGEIAELVPRLHAMGVKVGVFGFTDRNRSYRGQPDADKILGAWKDYADLGVDSLFVDEESGAGGLDVPEACLEHCDELRKRFKLPVGIFLYGKASDAKRVGTIARRVDIVGEMSYNLFLDAAGDYALADVTRTWSEAVRTGAEGRCAYWTGAMVCEKAAEGPGTPFWRERFGTRSQADYFRDYFSVARAQGAQGVYFHSLCRLARRVPESGQDEILKALKSFFSGR